MKRLKVTLQDMTTPSAPGREHAYSVSDETDDLILEEIVRWVRAKGRGVLDESDDEETSE